METFNLQNGIKVIFKKTNSVEILSLKLVSPISILHEDISKAGSTLLLHNVMNKSTKNRNSENLQFDIENLGSSISSFVDYDYSSWSLECICQNFDKSCEILSDIILNPNFDQKEFEKEKDMIIQGLIARKDNIKLSADDKFRSDFFDKGHPYSNSKIGNIESVKSVTIQDLKDVYDKIYSTKGLIIVVAGNIKKSVLKQILNKYFAQIKLTQEKPKINFKPNPMRTDDDIVVKSKFNQAFIIYAYDCPNLFSKDFVTLKIINYILGSRMTGRLFIELREKLGLAYEVNSVYPTYVDSSFFKIYIGLDKKNIDITKKGFEKIVNDLCVTKVSDTELINTKNFVKGFYLLEHQTVEKMTDYISSREITGLGYEYDEKYIDLLLQVTSDDIIKVANKYFKQKPYKLILMPN